MLRSRSRIVVAVVVALCVSVSMSFTAQSSAQTATGTKTRPTTAFGRLSPPAVVPVAGSGFKLTGRLASKVRRVVDLQQRRGTRFTTIATGTSTRLGTFTFSDVVLDGPATLRVRAPRHKVNPKSPGLRPVITKPVDVDVQGQSSELTALPPIVQQGPAPTAPDDRAQVVARFSPPRPGRAVQLERLTGAAWVPVQTAAQNDAGTAAFAVDDVATYRAITVATTEGLAAQATSAVTTRLWAPVFEETFTGAALNTAVWNDQVRENNPAGRRTCARVDPSARRVADGVLHLGIGYDQTRRGQPCATISTSGNLQDARSVPYLVNSQVATERSFTYQYGFAAARMKLQRDKGMHSGFWMLASGPWLLTDQGLLRPCDTEVDAMEFFGENPRSEPAVGAFVHKCTPGQPTTSYGELFSETASMKPVGDTWWDSFHVFSVEWTPTAYVFRVDGAEFHRETRGVSHQPAFLVLSMLTSDYELENLTPARMGQTAQVDWVRVWQ